MKILIWNEFRLENKGGPAGYLYNLNKYEVLSKKIKFLNKYSEENFFIKKKKERLKKYEVLKKIKKNLNNIKEVGLIFKKNKILENRNISIIHYHLTLDFYKNRDFIKKYTGITVLTSHSPQLASEELVNNMNIKNNKIKKLIFNFIKRYDYYAFKKTDYIIFPCKDAMEPYLKRDIKIKKILDEKLKNNKVKFLETGIEDKKIDFKEEYFYNKFNIPKDAIVLCYIGRHNEIKGYDLALKMGEEIIKKYENIYIIIAGKINEEIPPLKHERWIELGWTIETDNIIKHAHAYLLPNRETYFDLIFIEALRAGGTIICSETGGNKYFKKFKSSDIIYFEKENVNQLIEVVENNLEKFSAKNYIKNRKENRKIYEENFTIDKFGKKYIEIMEKIYEEGK